MKKTVLILLVLALGAFPVLARPAPSAAAGHEGLTRIDGTIRGYPYTLLRPDEWNGDLVLLMHGSAAWWFEIFGPILADLGYGVAWATFNDDTGTGQTAALKEVPLLTRVVQAQFTARFGAPQHTFLYAFSRGASHSLKLLETSPARYDGVVSACGGNISTEEKFKYSISTRVLFDYFYPGVIPGTPLESPFNTLEETLAVIVPGIVQAIMADPAPARELARTNFYNLPEDLPEPVLIQYIIESVMILPSIVNDTIASLGGSPFDNAQVVYSGSADDAALNAGVARFSAEPHDEHFLRVWSNPSGDLGQTPYLVLHSPLDGTIPDWYFNERFQELVDSAGSSDYLLRRTSRSLFHCNFPMDELLGALEDLKTWVETGVKPEL
jgi:pimeloyl-ACP methyl ester carboxylesterase